MPLIKSISGIRGTIGGEPGENLSPIDILKFTSAYGFFISQKNADTIEAGTIATRQKIIIGRDGRVSGEMVKDLVVGALLSSGLNVIDLGLATTPTVEMVVIQEEAQGGVIITASHNPQGWNALKFLNEKGEFLSAAEGSQIIELVAKADKNLSTVSEDKLGLYTFNSSLVQNHLDSIISLDLVDKELIKKKKFRVVVDGINSVGGVVVPKLLKSLGVEDIIEINCESNGLFNHKPEPIEENLSTIMAQVRESKADLGIVVDPDVDRLAFIDENGKFFGEEYTLVAVADYILKNFSLIETKFPGQYSLATVSNLSSSRALRDIADKYQAEYLASAVGEVNVVSVMKEAKAVIGGEGNGGIIYSPLHYGRDALVGLALFLSTLALSNKKISEFRQEFPSYFMLKDKIELPAHFDMVVLLEKIKNYYQELETGELSQLVVTETDGLKLDWPDSWLHLRVSNTEPIMRIYGESFSQAEIISKITELKSKILAYIK